MIGYYVAPPTAGHAHRGVHRLYISIAKRIRFLALAHITSLAVNEYVVYYILESYIITS